MNVYVSIKCKFQGISLVELSDVPEVWDSDHPWSPDTRWSLANKCSVWLWQFIIILTHDYYQTGWHITTTTIYHSVIALVNMVLKYGIYKIECSLLFMILPLNMQVQYNSIYHSTIVPLSYVVQLSVFYYLSFSYWTIENDSKIQLAAYYNLSLSNCTNKSEGTIQTDCLLLFYHSTNIPLNVMVQYNWLLVFPWHLYYYWCLIRDVWMK